MNLMRSISVADRFSLAGLEKLCAVYLHERINADNVVAIYREVTEKLPVLGKHIMIEPLCIPLVFYVSVS